MPRKTLFTKLRLAAPETCKRACPEASHELLSGIATRADLRDGSLLVTTSADGGHPLRDWYRGVAQGAWAERDSSYFLRHFRSQAGHAVGWDCWIWAGI